MAERNRTSRRGRGTSVTPEDLKDLVAAHVTATKIGRRIEELLLEHGLGDVFDEPDKVDVSMDNNGPDVPTILIDGTGDNHVYEIRVWFD